MRVSGENICLDGRPSSRPSSLLMGRSQHQEMTATVRRIKLPEPLWPKARLRALDERADFQDVVARALVHYLRTPVKREART